MNARTGSTWMWLLAFDGPWDGQRVKVPTDTREIPVLDEAEMIRNRSRALMGPRAPLPIAGVYKVGHVLKHGLGLRWYPAPRPRALDGSEDAQP